MFLKRTVTDIRADVDQHATDIRTELERSTAVLALALVVVGALAAFAVCVAVTSD